MEKEDLRGGEGKRGQEIESLKVFFPKYTYVYLFFYSIRCSRDKNFEALLSISKNPTSQREREGEGEGKHQRSAKRSEEREERKEGAKTHSDCVI